MVGKQAGKRHDLEDEIDALSQMQAKKQSGACQPSMMSLHGVSVLGGQANGGAHQQS